MMSSLRVEPLPDVRAVIGEGPMWEESEQTLLFVDIQGRKIHRWNSATNQIKALSTDGPVGFAVAVKGGGYVAGVGRTFSSVNWSTGAVTSLVTVDEDKPKNRLNDGKVDPTGRLYAGTMGPDEGGETVRKQGAFYSLDSNLKIYQHLDQVDISNGLDWSSDGRLFFYVDSLRKSVDVFDYDITSGHIANRRVLYQLQLPEGLPDGLTLDAVGNLWLSVWDGGRVLHIDTNTGALLRTVSLPASKTTSCCFGGPAYSDLFVTSASLGLSQSELSAQPLAGSTFRISGLGVKGRPPVEFAGKVFK